MFFMLLFLLGDSGALQDYIDVEDYWADQGLEMTVQNMREVLAGPAQPPADLSSLVTSLGAESFEEREAAEKQLAAKGAAARSALEKALSVQDPEIRQRAKNLLAKLPAADADTVGEMKRMALLTLSRMEEAGAKGLLQEVLPENPLEEKTPLSRDERLSRFPADTHLFLQLEAGNKPGTVVKKVRNSPMIQEKLREFWMKSGDLRIDRITFSLNGEMLRMSPAGVGIVWIEGQYEAEKLTVLLDDMGLNSEEKGAVWTRDGLIIVLHPNRQEVFVLFNPDESVSYDDLEDLGKVLVGKNQRDGAVPEAVKNLLPEESKQGQLWAVARLPEDSKGIPGLPSKLLKAAVSLSRKENAFNSQFSATFADAEGAQAVKALIEGQLHEIKEEIFQHPVPEMEGYQKLLEGIKVSSESEQLNIQAALPDSFRILMVQQMEQMLGMMQQMRQRQHQMMLEQHQMMLEQQMNQIAE